MAEAGTGVGKSFAYLVPSVLWASRNKERVVVSTATINLQQQLFEKDIPLVQKALGTNVKAVLVKGRRNYLCPHRLADELKDVSFESTVPVDQLNAIADWAAQTRTGDVSELGFLPDEALWGRLCSDQDTCHGVRCAQKDGCFLAKARKEAAGAGLLVANHHLLFADLALRMNGFGADATAVLPPFQRIVFDEAHHIEKSATSYFSSEFNRPFLNKLLNRLYRARRGRPSGIILTLQGLGTESIDFGLFPTLVAEVADQADLYNDKALEVLGGSFNLRLAGAEGMDALDRLLGPLTALQKPLLQLAELCKKLGEVWDQEKEVPPEAWEVKTIGRKLEALSQTIDRCRKFDQDPRQRLLARPPQGRVRQRARRAGHLAADHRQAHGSGRVRPLRHGVDDQRHPGGEGRVRVLGQPRRPSAGRPGEAAVGGVSLAVRLRPPGAHRLPRGFSVPRSRILPSEALRNSSPTFSVPREAAPWCCSPATRA